MAVSDVLRKGLNFFNQSKSVLGTILATTAPLVNSAMQFNGDHKGMYTSSSKEYKPETSSLAKTMVGMGTAMSTGDQQQELEKFTEEFNKNFDTNFKKLFDKHFLAWEAKNPGATPEQIDKVRTLITQMVERALFSRFSEGLRVIRLKGTGVKGFTL